MSLLRTLGLIDYETTEDAPAPEAPAPAEPAPEPAPEPEEPAEPEAWVGPSQEEWQQSQNALQQATEFINLLQQPQYQEAEPQVEQLPEYDPFDPDSAVAYMEARDQRLLGAMQQMIAPMTEQHQNENAVRWAEETLGRLGVPEEDHWRDGVLFASAGFQQYDAYGRPLVTPQQATQQGYEFLRRFAEAERAAEREAMKQQNDQTDQTIKNRAEAPNLPAGPAGAEGVPQGIDELQAARIWREKQAATS